MSQAEVAEVLTVPLVCADAVNCVAGARLTVGLTVGLDIAVRTTTHRFTPPSAPACNGTSCVAPCGWLTKWDS